MRQISNVGWCYLVFGSSMCAYFCAAALGGWGGTGWSQGPPGSAFSPGGHGHSYSSGAYHGRSSGGFGGGGK